MLMFKWPWYFTQIYIHINVNRKNLICKNSTNIYDPQSIVCETKTKPTNIVSPPTNYSIHFIDREIKYKHNKNKTCWQPTHSISSPPDGAFPCRVLATKTLFSPQTLHALPRFSLKTRRSHSFVWCPKVHTKCSGINQSHYLLFDWHQNIQTRSQVFVPNWLWSLPQTFTWERMAKKNFTCFTKPHNLLSLHLHLT